MNSKSFKDTYSPSTSTSFLPQLRNSRRGSIVSLASTTQVDKETLSQALDQIHSTASQSDTLTTFNEFTSPPSSSLGPDAKGIASDLHGGLSGLYTRIRASVGNVKDLVSLGVDDAVGEPASVASPMVSTHSPAPSTNSGSGPTRVANFSTAHISRGSLPGSEQHSPVAPKFNDPFPSSHGGTSKPLKTFLGSSHASSKSGSGSNEAIQKAPATLTQAGKPTVVSPALAEVNIRAVKQLSPSDQYSSDTRSITSATFESDKRYAPAQKSQSESHIAGETKSSVAEPRTYRKPGAIILSHQVIEPLRAGAEADPVLRNYVPDGREPEMLYSKNVEAIVQPFLDIDNGEKDENAITSSSDGDEDNGRPPKIIATSGNNEDDVFQTTTKHEGNDAASEIVGSGSYQHLELPLRKVTAPPLTTTSLSFNSNLSTASSSETNFGRSISPPPHRSSLLAPTEENGMPRRESGPARSIGSDGGLHRHPNTVNVNSRVKNKILDKEYWMKDENARDCFYCGDAFSTFRRKHHCSKPTFVLYHWILPCHFIDT